jgi:hypothetical protein
MTRPCSAVQLHAAHQQHLTSDMNIIVYLGAERGGLGGSPVVASLLLSVVAVALAAAATAARAAAV